MSGSVCREGMSWDLEGMTIVVKEHGVQVLRIFVGEAMEGIGRHLIETHINCIEHSPWIAAWHEDATEVTLDDLLDD